MLDTLVRWDTALFSVFNQDLTHPVLDLVMPVISSTALVWVLLAPILIWLLWRCRRHRDALQGLLRKIVFVALCVLVANLATDAVKSMRLRVRPFNALPHARYVDEHDGWESRPDTFTPKHESGTSFFSGHAANTMALATGVAIAFPPAAPAVYALPLAVGYSRVYLGKHYPGDVGLGWLCGWLAAWSLARLARRKGWLTGRRDKA